MEAERERAPFCDDEPRHGRSAERGEFSKALLVETFDRQREYGFARCGDEKQAAALEIRKGRG